MNNFNWEDYESQDQEQPAEKASNLSVKFFNPQETQTTQPSQQQSFNWEEYESPKEEPITPSQQNEEEPSYFGLSEVPGQASKGLAQGTLGTYGDILDLFGLQAKEILPGQKAQYEAEFNASPEQLAHLVETDEPAPRFGRISSGEQVGSLIKELGGPGEAKSLPGRLASRAGKFVGGSAALVNPALKSPIAAAGAGQALEELGAPPWMQAIGEIAASFRFSDKKVPIKSNSPEVESKLKDLRKMGYTQEDLTLAKSALEDKGLFKKVSKKTASSEQKFEQALSNSEKHIDSVLNKSFPGLEKGTEHMRKVGSELYDSLDEFAKSVKIKKPEIFIDKAQNLIKDFRKTLANTPQEEQIIALLEKAINTAKHHPTSDYYTRFYKGMNSIGNWSNPKERERVFSTIKSALKDTFNAQGPEGIKLANKLEEANSHWIKFRNAEDVSDIFKKATTDEGINFKKLKKSFENPNTLETLTSAVGEESAQKLKLIANIGEKITDLKKTMDGGTIKQFFGAGKLYAIGKALVFQDYRELTAMVGAEAAQRLSTLALTSPRMQNITIEILNGVKDGKYNHLRQLALEADKMIEK